jgi:hypothetical protein
VHRRAETFAPDEFRFSSAAHMSAFDPDITRNVSSERQPFGCPFLCPGERGQQQCVLVMDRAESRSAPMIPTGISKGGILMTIRLLGGCLLLVASTFGAGAQMSPPPPTSTPGASSTTSVSPATHCRDSSGAARLNSAISGSSSTTGAASNTPSLGNPAASSSVNSTPSSTTDTSLPPC